MRLDCVIGCRVILIHCRELEGRCFAHSVKGRSVVLVDTSNFRLLRSSYILNDSNSEALWILVGATTVNALGGIDLARVRCSLANSDGTNNTPGSFEFYKTLPFL